MNPAVQKTLSLLLLIFIGILLKKKIHGKERLNGIKTLILSIALPATIFVALLKVKVDVTLLILPVIALLINLLLLFIIRYVYPFFSGKPFDNSDSRTIILLIPSLAPGLSCFPFITEYFGEEALAFAALADIGNKIFVLIILYLVAMQWYYKIQKGSLENAQSNIKGLLGSLMSEPVNLVILVAIIMLSFGFNMTSLPAFLQEGIGRMSMLMTPMVLIFIGLAVNINWREFRKIVSILLLRSGIAFLLSGLIISILPISSTTLVLLAIVFPQSACSFWPFAHISAVSNMEKNNQLNKSTFNMGLALNILAISLPLSTVIILSICSFPDVFVHPNPVFGLAAIGITAGILGIVSPNRIGTSSKVLVSHLKK